MNSFAEILTCKNKSSLRKLCTSKTVKMSDFVEVITHCKAGLTHLNHTMRFFDYVPPHLNATDSDFDVLNSDSNIQSSKFGQKSLRKIFKDHGERKYKVGHIFFSKEQSNPITEWHFIFFELGELDVKNNHWCNGSHFHVTNYLWPNLDCQEIWNEFVLKNHFPKTKLHVAILDD